MLKPAFGLQPIDHHGDLKCPRVMRVRVFDTGTYAQSHTAKRILGVPGGTS